MEESTKKKTVKELRESLGLTQQDLAVRTNSHWRTVSDWETKGIVPKFDKALALAKVLRVPLKTLADSMGLDTAGIPDDSPN